MTATYFILLDLKSRNKSIRLLPNRMVPMNVRPFDGHHRQNPAKPIPTNLLRENNQEITSRSRTIHRHPLPADLLLISQQNKIRSPSINEQYHRNYKTPNKENVDNSHTKHHERTTPTVK